jgi:hypothetical protein
MVGALIASEALAVLELAVPVIVAVVLDATATVVTDAVPVVAPAGIVSVAGTVAEGELEVKVTG